MYSVSYRHGKQTNKHVSGTVCNEYEWTVLYTYWAINSSLVILHNVITTVIYILSWIYSSLFWCDSVASVARSESSPSECQKLYTLYQFKNVMELELPQVCRNINILQVHSQFTKQTCESRNVTLLPTFLLLFGISVCSVVSVFPVAHSFGFFLTLRLLLRRLIKRASLPGKNKFYTLIHIKNNVCVCARTHVDPCSDSLQSTG